MIIAWIGYCLLVSALLGLAALATERALGHYRKPVRGVWAAALAGSVILPIAAYVAPTLVSQIWTVTVSLPVGLPEGVALSGVAATADAGGFDWAGLLGMVGVGLGVVWAVSVLAFGGYLVVTHRRLRREMRGWTPGEILDAPVMLSRDCGPAVVGVGKSMIVMPAWISELDEEVLRLVFLHEREHLVAGDNRLFLLGLLSLAAMPWNPVAWWQVRRLRLAIEFDCDRRVMAHGVEPRDYAEALLAVGSRLTSAPLAAVAFAEKRPAVERRLRRLTDPLRRLRGPRSLAALALGGLAVVFACSSPLPMDAPGVEVQAVPNAPDASEKPTFIPYDDPPSLQNREKMSELLRAAYPADLKAAGVGGRAELWLYIDEEGNVANQQVKTSSGNANLDAAAGAVVREMKFEPASHEGVETPVWVSQWVTFDRDADAEAEKREPTPDAPAVEVIPDADGTAVAGRVRFRAAEDGATRPSIVEGADGAVARYREVPSGGAGADEAVGGGVLRRLPSMDQEAGSQEAPLIVIDGVIQGEGTSMEDVRALNIDSVEILKGPAAETRYGSRAANGAILITTKDGEARAERVRPGDIIGERPARIEPRIGAVPLIVIDGVIQSPGTEVSDVRSMDIDRIEIIKGAAAEELYGSRARNGVIQIFTKDGSAP